MGTRFTALYTNVVKTDHKLDNLTREACYSNRNQYYADITNTISITFITANILKDTHTLAHSLTQIPGVTSCLCFNLRPPPLHTASTLHTHTHRKISLRTADATYTYIGEERRRNGSICLYIQCRLVVLQGCADAA